MEVSLADQYDHETYIDITNSTTEKQSYLVQQMTKAIHDEETDM